jgi:hypothetical protein
MKTSLQHFAGVLWGRKKESELANKGRFDGWHYWVDVWLADAKAQNLLSFAFNSKQSY